MIKLFQVLQTKHILSFLLYDLPLIEGSGLCLWDHVLPFTSLQLPSWSPFYTGHAHRAIRGANQRKEKSQSINKQTPRKVNYVVMFPRLYNMYPSAWFTLVISPYSGSYGPGIPWSLNQGGLLRAIWTWPILIPCNCGYQASLPLTDFPLDWKIQVWKYSGPLIRYFTQR